MNQERGKGSMDRERRDAQVSRDFDFPRAIVFNLLTDPKKGAVSWSPEGAVNLVFELDPRPGGTIRIHDRDSDGNVAKTIGTVMEIVVPELLVVRTATTPPTGTAPWEALQTLRFEEISPRKTRVTILVKVLATGSFPGGIEPLERAYQGGWGEVLEHLQSALR
ncbi:MAG: SRPBCC domain-containing protein [Candidatus Lutacidiplasmatales archaeon]